MKDVLLDYRFFEQQLGQPWNDERLRQALDAADLDYELADAANDGELSLVEQAGFELYFSAEAEDPERLVFSGVRFVRIGDLRSVGYEGEMPFDLRFSDTVAGAIGRVGREPDFREVDEDDRCEYLHWNLQPFRLHVLFDSDDGLVARVTLLAQAPYYLDWDSPFEL